MVRCSSVPPCQTNLTLWTNPSLRPLFQRETLVVCSCMRPSFYRGRGASVRTESEHVSQMNRRFTRNAIKRPFSVYSLPPTPSEWCAKGRFPVLVLRKCQMERRESAYFAFRNKNHFAISSVSCAQFSLICTLDP